MTRRSVLPTTLSVLLCACTGDVMTGDNGAADAGTSPMPDGSGPPPPPPPMADAGGPAPDAPPIIDPGDPGPADVHFTVDSSSGTHPVSRYVYGVNHPDWDGRADKTTLSRLGGNRWTAFNWENNASNAGSDWFHQNDGYLGGGDTPGEAVRGRVAEAHAHGASTVVTVPIAGYVAADKNGDGDVAATPSYLETRFRRSHAKKNAPFADPPNGGDGDVYQDEFVAWLEGEFPGARTDPARTLFYDLDNEPDLWSETHARIHPEPARYDELIGLNLEYAAAIKDVVPSALVFGFVSYGWAGYTSLQDAPDAAGRDFIETYLAEAAAADAAAGRRLIDVLDLHWYPEARGGGVRIVDDDASAAVAAARVQAPRSLWDPTYTEESWITMWSTMAPIRLIPRLRDKIAALYPGTRLAFTEYYYGGGAHISGGVAQADVLGIFGREEVFAATMWHLGSTDDAFIYGGFDMYLDYDGAGGAFGDVSVPAASDDVERTSVYASVASDDYGRMVLVVINKASTPLRAGITVSHGATFTSAEVYQLTAASSVPARAADLAITAVNAFVYEMPAMSVSTLVLRP